MTLPIALGTAQFGQAYGVANNTGSVAGEAAVDLVAAAWECGIREFDTASAYGDSELVLGTALRRLGLRDEAVVVTKTIHLTKEQLDDPGVARRVLVDSVEGSRRRLGMDTIPVVLFHRDDDARHLDVLLDLAGRGWIERVGVSCGHAPTSAIDLAGTAGIEAIQLPANVLDRRHLVGGAFDAALGLRVYVRSLYLQGLLAMPTHAVPAHLADVIPSLNVLDQLAAEAGLSRIELALRGGLSLPGDVRLLVGAETTTQVVQNCRWIAEGPLPLEVLDRLERELPATTPELLTPASWPSLLRERSQDSDVF